MENASKALIIAGGVLIGVLILSMFVYVFRSAAKTNQSYDEKMAQEQLEAYNAGFEVYNKNNNTIMDLLTVINLAYDTNVSCDYDPQNSVEILIKISENKYFRVLGDYDKKNYMSKNRVLIASNEKDIGSGKTVSIYDLVNKTFGDDVFKFQIPSSDENDKLSTTKLDGNETKYKYLFKCKEIRYDLKSGKVEFMKFELDGPQY